MNRRVVVTGLGWVTPLGRDVDAAFDALLGGRSGLALHRVGTGEPSYEVVAGICREFDPVAEFGKPRSNQMDRFSQLGLAAALDAWSMAGLEHLSPEARETVGVHWGTGVGATATMDRGYQDLLVNKKARISPLSIVLGMHNAAGSHIALALGLGGPCSTHSVACASATMAIGQAFQAIRAGSADVAVAGGSDAPFGLGSVAAWKSLQVLAEGDQASAPRACRPFSADRAGLVLAEAGAALVLEDYEHARARGATILAEMLGFGASCDHSHLTKPFQDGQVRALRAVLRDAQLMPKDVQYVNAHGTATQEGDPTEIAALRAVFEADAAALRVSATKSMHGHAMGAAGALEACITVMSLRRQRIPPTAGCEEVDVSCQGVRHVLGVGQDAADLRVALSSSFAFGGSNAVLALGQPG
ncbi:MAG: beta-ketoacyl-[acyl-carrier-protein] synthase family protein [Proteobacteria bacterium]|nr:beta-ketoacyl-[acyl-carrier-protein] synthase family protein [Pseudomonadota bacterium]